MSSLEDRNIILAGLKELKDSQEKRSKGITWQQILLIVLSVIILPGIVILVNDHYQLAHKANKEDLTSVVTRTNIVLHDVHENFLDVKDVLKDCENTKPLYLRNVNKLPPSSSTRSIGEYYGKPWEQFLCLVDHGYNRQRSIR